MCREQFIYAELKPQRKEAGSGTFKFTWVATIFLFQQKVFCASLYASHCDTDNQDVFTILIFSASALKLSANQKSQSGALNFGIFYLSIKFLIEAEFEIIIPRRLNVIANSNFSVWTEDLGRVMFF